MTGSSDLPGARGAAGASRENAERRRIIERLALSPDEAAESIGCSRDFLDLHVMPELRVARVGRRRFIPVSELQGWLDRNASRVPE